MTAQSRIGRVRHALADRKRLVAAITAGVLAVACVLAFVATQWANGLLPGSWTAADDVADNNAAASVAARKAVLAFVTYDYRTIDKDLASLRAQTTGTFKTDFENYGVQLAAAARQQRSVSNGNVGKIGVGAVGPGSAVIDVSATKKQVDGVGATDGKKTTEATFEFLFHLTMTKTDGRWLVSKLDVARVS